MSNKASHLKRLYKLFLKTGYAAVEGTAKNQKPMIKGLIRQGFDRYVYCTDPATLRELRPKGTLFTTHTHTLILIYN